MDKIMDIAIDEFTSPTPFTVTTEESVEKVFELMDREGIRHLPVLSNNKPVGIISERDLYMVRLLATEEELTAGKIMTDTPFCVKTGSLIDEVAYEMSKRKIGSALVVNENDELDGIFTSTDGLNALIEVIRGDLQ